MPENLVSRNGFGNNPVPRQPAHLHTQAESDAYLRDLPFPCPRSCLRIWSRETGSATIPSRVSLLISILRLNLMLTCEIFPSSATVSIYLKYRHTPSGQSRVYRVTQLRTDGVHCRESAGTGPVNLKVVPNECCLGRSPSTN